MCKGSITVTDIISDNKSKAVDRKELNYSRKPAILSCFKKQEVIQMPQIASSTLVLWATNMHAIP